MMVSQYCNLPRIFAALSLFFCAVSTAAQPLLKPTEVEAPPLTLEQVEPLIGGRSLFSLHLENASMDDALGAAKRETGVSWRLGLRSAPRGPITLDLKEQPVWSVYDALRGTVELSRRVSEGVVGRDAILLSALPSFQPLATRDLGLMQVRAGTARLTKSQWSLPLTIIVDPKLQIVASSTRLRLLEASDENGNDLLGTDRLSRWYSLYPLIWSASIVQPRPENMGTRLAKLRGVLDCSLVLRREQWEIPLKEAVFPVTKQWEVADATETISVDSVEKTPDGTYQVQLTRIRQQLINPRFLSLPESRRLELFNLSLFNGIKLLDEQGRAFILQKTTVQAELDGATTSRSVVATFARFPPTTATPSAPAATPPVTATTPVGDATRIVWDIPLETRPVQVAFEFEDLPLTVVP